MKDLLFFENMITPKIINVVYWLMLIGVVIGGLTAMFTKQFIPGLIGMLAGLVSTRIFCELLIVLFKMNEALQDLRRQ